MGSLCFNYLYSVLPFSPALGIHPWYALDVVFASRNAHLKYFRSSIFQKIWIKIPLTVMDQTLLNCRDCQCPGQAKFWVWLELMALENLLPRCSEVDQRLSLFSFMVDFGNTTPHLLIFFL